MLRASSTEATGPALPGTTAMPIDSANARARTLSPNSRSAAGRGPTKTRPSAAHSSANSAFSARNP